MPKGRRELSLVSGDKCRDLAFALKRLSQPLVPFLVRHSSFLPLIPNEIKINEYATKFGKLAHFVKRGQLGAAFADVAKRHFGQYQIVFLIGCKPSTAGAAAPRKPTCRSAHPRSVFRSPNRNLFIPSGIDGSGEFRRNIGEGRQQLPADSFQTADPAVNVFFFMGMTDYDGSLKLNRIVMIDDLLKVVFRKVPLRIVTVRTKNLIPSHGVNYLICSSA
jgi:hypothetical protein